MKPEELMTKTSFNVSQTLLNNFTVAAIELTGKTKGNTEVFVMLIEEFCDEFRLKTGHFAKGKKN